MDFDSGICQSVDTHEAVTQLNTEGISSYFVWSLMIIYFVWSLMIEAILIIS